MILGATLYVADSVSAAAFYCDAFDMKLGYSVKHQNGTYLHAELEKDGDSIFSVSESNAEEIRKCIDRSADDESGCQPE